MGDIRSRAKRRSAPIRVLQFGEGNFLRAFVDYMIDVSNEEGTFDGQVAIVKPTSRGTLDTFRRQNNLYTVLTRGRQNGEIIDEGRLIRCVAQCISPYEDMQTFLKLAECESIEWVVSNTTEAGIALTGSERLDDQPAASFPGKLTQWLYARFVFFHGAPDKGVIVLPVELIEHNGDTLFGLICELAGRWQLGNAFIDWLRTACRFCNTLVDRIVTGRPADNAALSNELGYRDELMDACEPFALWVIECDDPEDMRVRMSWAGKRQDVVFTRDLSPYRERKVRILNGAHTSSVLAAYLAGEDIVRGMMAQPLLRAFVEKAVYEELVPTVALPQAEVRRFADAVMERFDNPFIDHSLLAISLNSVSKWKTRVLPGVRVWLERGVLPRCLTFSWAALAAFYRPSERCEDGTLRAQRGDEVYTVRDEQNVLDFFWAHRDEDGAALLRALSARQDFWGEDIGAWPGFVDQAIKDYNAIENLGMRAAIERLLDGAPEGADRA